MTARQQYLSYVRQGGDFFCSPQIGAGAGFDAKLAGKTWLSETTTEDTIKACRQFDMLPLFNFPLPDLSCLCDSLRWETVSEALLPDGKRHTVRRLSTPRGDLETHFLEQPLLGGAQTKFPVTEEANLSLLEYYLDCLLECSDFSPITRAVQEIRRQVGEDDALDIQWAMQPYELLGFPNVLDTSVLALECPHTFRRLMDKILLLDERLLPAVAAGGADFVFLGGPGSELIPPAYYEEFLIPYSRTLSAMAHAQGLLIYSHICSPIEPMLSLGYYNQMGIDLFETLSESPVGNVKSLEDAFSKLDSAICTRGNLGLDLLLTASPAEILDRSVRILETAQRMGRKHILAASDYLFYDTPAENVHAMCEAVRRFHSL